MYRTNFKSISITALMILLLNCSSEELVKAPESYKKNNISVTEEELSKNFYNKSISEINTLDLRKENNLEDFKNAFFNKFDSPSENNYFTGDQFNYEEKKEHFKKIRKLKYLLVESSGEFVFKDYDFKKEEFPLQYITASPPKIEIEKSYYVPGQYGTRISFGGTEFQSIFFPIPKESAKDFFHVLNRKVLNWTILWEIKAVKDLQLTKCASLKDINNFWLFAVKTCTQQNWENLKIRKLKVSMVSYIAKDSSGNIVASGKAISRD